MSMISAQCDELRQMAESVGLVMPQAATLMMEAADTIWELRCRLVDAEVRVRKSAELCKLCELEAENSKLRELLRDTLTTISWCTIDCCPSDNKKRELNARACELGIELNDCE